MHVRYRYRIYPTDPQREALARTFGCARVVYNDFLAVKRKAHERGERISDGDAKRIVLTAAKSTPERAWLSEVSSRPLHRAVQDARRAYKNWFDSMSGKRKGRKVGPPRFKSRRDNRQSAGFTREAFWIDPNGALRLTKVGSIKVAWSRGLPSEPSSVTIIKEADGRYYASFVVERERDPLPKINRASGVDLGLTDLACVASSNGTRQRIPNPRHLRARERQLARAQKALSRKKNGSKNRSKARARVAVLHRRVRETRLDYLHKLSSALVSENQALAFEDLAVAGLSRTHLAKSVHDVGWSTLLRLCEYKAAEAGRQFVKIDRWHPSSQICAVCGRKDGKKPLSVRTRECPCGAILDRDFNAALNILDAAGLAESLNACGGDVRLALASANPSETRIHLKETA